MSEKLDADSKKLDFIFTYANHVLQKYLMKKFNINLSSACKVPVKTPSILFTLKDTQYNIYLDIVDKNYILDLDIILNNVDELCEKENIKKELIKHCTFLINAVNSSFNYLKRTLKYSKDDDEYLLINENLLIDENTNLYIEETDDYKIGIIIQ